MVHSPFRLETPSSPNLLVPITSVINEDCDPTFCGSRGSSYIDVTAVGMDLLEDVSCWHLPAYSLSYHKAIEFDIALNSNSPTKDGDNCIFNLKKANCKLFYDSSKYLLSSISDLIVSCQNPESLHDLAKELISIQNSCKMSIPIKKQGMQSSLVDNRNWLHEKTL
ncbi:hypothetical protein TNIN_47071 [Trichonephila inaurata madagascariensis]|uniref:Uncharacterized protein n=1 Tax=Trichonephila inaurata madagascariensis TaxID=2747483 RepID=A0A8X7CKR4_9ARAC|nr:hypothetical protein TNIN_47071 [Trichonephila inaurata madagascariensis]